MAIKGLLHVTILQKVELVAAAKSLKEIQDSRKTGRVFPPELLVMALNLCWNAIGPLADHEKSLVCVCEFPELLIMPEKKAGSK